MRNCRDDRETERFQRQPKTCVSVFKRMIETLQTKYPNVIVHLCEIRNDFFGELITVVGLITGQDLKAQSGRPLEEIASAVLYVKKRRRSIS